MPERKNMPWTAAGTVSFLVLWEILARAAGNDLILPGPLPVFFRFADLVKSEDFFPALGQSFLRVLTGMALSVPLGIGAGIASGLDRRVRAFLRPFFSLVTATPVMAVILIAFLWFGQERTPLFTAFLVVFPIMCANTAAGISSVDPLLLEFAASYSLKKRERFFHIYLPSILPFVLGGIKSSLSLCWKVVAAAEILLQPARALGTGMQRARAELETPELFAWTLAVVLAAALSELLLSVILRLYKRRLP